MASSLLIANPSRVPAPLVPSDPGAAPTLSTSPLMAAPTPMLSANPLPNVGVSQTLTDVDKLHAMQAQGSGVTQIQNPWLRGVARVADVIGQVLAPNVERLIPKTEGHYRDDLARQSGVVEQDQQIEQSKADIAQRNALATQEQAKAAELLNPVKKVTPGHLVVAQDGSAAGYQDADGTLKPLDDPSVPQGVRAVAQNMAGKPVKTPLSETPLDSQEASARNALWDKLAAKHGLPTGQFTPGMSRAEASAIASNLGTVLGKQNNDTHVSISLQGLQNQENKNATPSANDPAQQAAVASVANGSVKLQDVFGRGATSAQKAAFVAQVKALNPNYNSGDHDIENASRKYMITGAGGVSLTANNTVLHHLDLYDKAADAMHNGDIKALNQIGNELGLQLGSDAKTNLALIRTGVAIEAAKAYKGGPPDASEVKDFEHNLSGDGSPQQMHGGAATVRGMLRGKNEALRAQAEAGARGQANFGSSGGGAPVEEYVRVNGKLVRK